MFVITTLLICLFGQLPDNRELGEGNQPVDANRNLIFVFVISSAFTDSRFPEYSSVPSVVVLFPVYH